MLCSWDAEEYGLMGSWEWVEVHVLFISMPFLTVNLKSVQKSSQMSC